MASDRLTIERARPGMLPDNLAEIIEEEMREWRGANGGVFAIPACALGISIAIQAAMHRDNASEPTLAALLAERAPEFLAAVREWHSEWGECLQDETDAALATAIERAGLIAQEPRTTEREATIREGWWA